MSGRKSLLDVEQEERAKKRRKISPPRNILKKPEDPSVSTPTSATPALHSGDNGSAAGENRQSPRIAAKKMSSESNNKVEEHLRLDNSGVEAAEAAYANDFIEMEMVDVARESSRLLEIHEKQTSLLQQLEAEMERCLTLKEKVEDDGAGDEALELVKTDYAQCKEALQSLLLLASTLGDEGIQTSREIGNITDNKLNILDHDYDNLVEEQNKQQEVVEADSNSNQSQESHFRKTKKSSRRSVAGTPTKGKNLLETDADNSLVKQSSRERLRLYTASPVPSNSSSCSSKKPVKDFLALDTQAIDDSGYRACKFKNLPKYSGMCSNVSRFKVIRRKKRATQDDDESDSDSGTGGDSKDEGKGSQSSKSSQPEPVYCLCQKVSSGTMIQCDNDLCPMEWFHFKCVGLKRTPEKWFCPNCRGESISVSKPKSVLLLQLEEFNKKMEAKAAAKAK